MLPQIYCDMDGVLVAFEEGVTRLMNNYLKEYSQREKKKNKLANKIIDDLGRNYIDISEINLKKPPVRSLMFSLIKRPRNHRFWPELDWAPGGKVLWDFLKKYNPIILSSPVIDDPNCIPGKKEWCKTNLNWPPEKVIVQTNKEAYAITDENPAILIDDSVKKITKWNDAGGIGVLYQTGNPGKTIDYIKTLDNAGI